jgi:hypothetical protein
LRGLLTVALSAGESWPVDVAADGPFLMLKRDVADAQHFVMVWHCVAELARLMPQSNACA